MKKNIFFNLFFVVFINILVKPLWIFWIDRGIQNSVTLEHYGIYFSLFNLSLLFNGLLDIGITQFNTQHVAKHPALLDKYVGYFLGSKLSLGLLYLMVILGFCWQQNELITWEMLITLGLTQFFSSLLLFFRSNISAHQRFFTDSIFSVADKVLLLGAGFWVLSHAQVWSDMDVLRNFCYAQLFSTGITCLAAAAMNRTFIKSLIPSWNTHVSLLLLKKSLPYAGFVLLSTLYYRYDPFIIDRFYTQSASLLGVYAQSFRLIEAFNIVGYLWAGILFPLMARWIVKNDGRMAELLKQSSNVLLSAVLTLCVGVSFFSEEITHLLYPGQENPYILSILIWMLIPQAIHHVYSSYLTALAQLKLLNILSSTALVLGISLNILIQPLQSLQGVIFVNIGVQILVSASFVYFCKQKLSCSFHKILDIKLLWYTLGIIGISYVLQKLNANWLLLAIIYVLASLAFLWALQLISFQKWRHWNTEDHL